MFNAATRSGFAIAWLVVAGCHPKPAPAAAVATNDVAGTPHAAAPVIDPLAFVPLNVAIVASPGAIRACMTLPETCYHHQPGARRLLVDPDVVVMRWHDVAIYAAKDEASAAARFFASDAPMRFAAAAFHLTGDLGIQRSSRSDFELIGRDAGFVVDGPDGFFIECFNCSAASVLSGLAALGVRIVPR